MQIGMICMFVKDITVAYTIILRVCFYCNCMNLCYIAACQQSGVTFATTNNTNGRNWDKKQWCLHCDPQTSHSKLPRHLISHHSNEVDVAIWMAEKEFTKKRALLDQIRNKGNYLHNCKVLQEGKGELSMRYRKANNATMDPDKYGTCNRCFGYLVLRDMWKHRCPVQKFLSPDDNRKGRPASEGRLMMPPPQGMSSKLNEVIQKGKQDEISRLIKSDESLLSWGQRLCFKKFNKEDQHSYIRSSLRTMSRLVVQLRQDTGLKDAYIVTFLHTCRYKAIVDAVRRICGFDETTSLYSNPSLAQKNWWAS